MSNYKRNGASRSTLRNTVNCAGVRYLERAADLLRCSKAGLPPTEANRLARCLGESFWKNKCLPLSHPVCRKGNESPRAHTDAFPRDPTSLTAYLSTPITARSSRSHSAPSLTGEVCKQPPTLACAQAFAAGGKLGAQLCKVPEKCGCCFKPRHHLTGHCTLTLPTTPHSWPLASSSFILSQNLQASYMFIKFLLCEASSQNVWGTKSKACSTSTTVPLAQVGRPTVFRSWPWARALH